MNANVVRAAQWLVAGMLVCTGLLLGGFYLIGRHHADRVIREFRAGDRREAVDPTFILPTADSKVNESEDFRIVGDEWRRMWFNDLPSQPTQERIHGGIQ